MTPPGTRAWHPFARVPGTGWRPCLALRNVPIAAQSRSGAGREGGFGDGASVTITGPTTTCAGKLTPFPAWTGFEVDKLARFPVRIGFEVDKLAPRPVRTGREADKLTRHPV